jgi:hypothetical protein
MSLLNNIFVSFEETFFMLLFINFYNSTDVMLVLTFPTISKSEEQKKVLKDQVYIFSQKLTFTQSKIII